MQANFSQIFERVSDSLPFCYGKLALRQTGENHKLKNKKKCLRKAMKTYTWDSYKPLSFHEWRDSNGYTDEWCKSEGIGINSLFNTKTIDVPYEKYLSKFYRTNKAVNEKHADIQNFNIIANLLAENEVLRKKI